MGLFSCVFLGGGEWDLFTSQLYVICCLFAELRPRLCSSKPRQPTSSTSLKAESKSFNQGIRGREVRYPSQGHTVRYQS